MTTGDHAAVCAADNVDSLSWNVHHSRLQCSMWWVVACRWLPDQEAMESTLESVVDNAYMYGRDFISQKVVVSVNLVN